MIITSRRVGAMVNPGLVKPSRIDVGSKTASHRHRWRSSTRRVVTVSHCKNGTTSHNATCAHCRQMSVTYQTR